VDLEGVKDTVRERAEAEPADVPEEAVEPTELRPSSVFLSDCLEFVDRTGANFLLRWLILLTGLKT